MRFKKIKEIKNCGAFDSFNWKGPDLRRYNLIYGWNGSGKTTTSRIFRSIENGCAAAELGVTEFQVSSDGGTIKKEDLTAPSPNVRVYNDDFIAENLKFNESKTKQILIAGKATIETEDEIRDLETRKKDATAEKKILDDRLEKIHKLPEKILTLTGSAVVQQFADTPLGTGDYSGRRYDRNYVEKLLAEGTISETNTDSLIIVKQEDIDRRREVIKSQRQKVSVFPQEINDFSDVFSDANTLLLSSPMVETIDELTCDNQRRSWVEQGYAIHNERKSKDCLFCGKEFDPGYIERLGKFFTRELEETKKKIDLAVGSLSSPSVSGEIAGPDTGLLLPDLSIEYISFKAEAEKHAVEIRATLGKMTDALKTKRENPQGKSGEIATVEYPAKPIIEFNKVIRKMVGTIKRHNEQIDKKIEAAKEIEFHVIAKTLKDKDYFIVKAECDSLILHTKKLGDEIDSIDKAVATKRSAILNAGIAIDKINAILGEFFGDGHIYLEPNIVDDDIGYLLKRRGKSANYLSEGEKSAVALAYFLTKLEEGGFNYKNGVVVVDDPVDSQDEVFLFRAFSLLKRHLTPCGQIILLTHNFPLFNLVRDWLANENNKRKREKKDLEAEFFLIKSYRNASISEMQIEALHDLLLNYKTEYQYLFHQLYKFNSGSSDIDEPIVPNIGRKVLEYFASFKWSCNVDEKLGNIIQKKYIDSHVATVDERAMGDFIKKFIDEYSHGRDFSRPISAPMFEARPVCERILEFIKSADPEHYESLVRLCEGELGE